MALMSHRLRTPLSAVLGFAQVMAQDPTEPLSPRQRERLARIDAAGTELLAMIDDVFELAALDAEPAPPVRAPVPLASLATQLRESIEPLARLRGVALRFPAAWPEVQVHTDRRLLGQALRHLAAHAVRRNERGGHVTLTAAIEAGWARLELRDGGPRLSAEQRELLFDTPAADDGQATHGDALVGLDLVRQALGRLGAQVEWMHPDPADNVLLVRLPLADQAGPSAPAAMTLLCIEDNPVNLMLVQELVAMRPGIVLHSAVDGSSGLAAAAALRPDVVLLDLHLPDMDGRQVAAQLRADPRTAGCRLVALSANAMPEDIREARAQGFDDYWTKPIDFDRFLGGLDAIASALATARAAP
jgi:CheY-like chemotaxis protein